MSKLFLHESEDSKPVALLKVWPYVDSTSSRRAYLSPVQIGSLGSVQEGEVSMSNMVRARVVVRGTRTLLQHHMGPDGIPLQKGEKTGVAGNDPEEWKKSCMVLKDSELYLPGTYIFGVLRNGARFTKKGKSNLQNDIQSTLQVEEDIIRYLLVRSK